MSASENKFVIDRKYLLSLSRDQAMNGIGHEFGHYSTQDEIATKDQSVANYTGSLLEKHTKKIESKPISEATWDGLLNTSSVITGPGAEVIASGIAVNEREYISTELFTSEAYSFGGRVSRTQSAFMLKNDENKTITTYNIGSTSIGFGLLDIGVSTGIGFYINDSIEKLSELTMSGGGSVAVGPYGAGVDILKKPYIQRNESIPKELLNFVRTFRGIRFYIGKNIPNPMILDAHVTFIEIGTPKNIKGDKKAYDVLDKFIKDSRERGGEW